MQEQPPKDLESLQCHDPDLLIFQGSIAPHLHVLSPGLLKAGYYWNLRVGDLSGQERLLWGEDELYLNSHEQIETTF